MLLNTDKQIVDDMINLVDPTVPVTERQLLFYGWYINDNEWINQEGYTYYGHSKYFRLHIYRNPRNIFLVSFHGSNEFAKQFNTIKELEDLIYAAGPRYYDNEGD